VARGQTGHAEQYPVPGAQIKFCPPRVEGGGEGAIIEGLGGRNVGATAAIDKIMPGWEPHRPGYALNWKCLDVVAFPGDFYKPPCQDISCFSMGSWRFNGVKGCIG